jgi:hypothetical protein
MMRAQKLATVNRLLAKQARALFLVHETCKIYGCLIFQTFFYLN